MRRNNFKRVAAFSMAAVMLCGSAFTVMAADETNSAEGTGKYEGKDGEKPLISITLPTSAELTGVYDYIADPNDLLSQAKDHGSLGSSATIETNAGILFKTDTNKYGPKSKKFEVESQNMQDIDVTVAVKIKEAGDSLIKYAADDTFTDSTDNELYLALTNAAASADDLEAVPLTAAGATMTQSAAGVEGNYELKYNTTDSKYEYALKGSGTTAWNKVAFDMTGAINTAAEWGEGVKFPKIEVTWSYAEHKDAYVSATSVSTAAKSLTLSLPTGVTVSKVELVLSGNTTALISGNQYSVSATAINFTKYASSWAGGSLKITYSDGHVDTVTCQ